MRVVRVDGRAPDPRALAEAADVLARDELVIYPTDTLYALGARALSEAAAARVREVKGRKERKPLPLIAADVLQARSLFADWPEGAERLARSFWPGPLTIVLPASAAVPAAVRAGSAGVAVRVPDLPLARRLCDLAGPLVSTSANRSGEPPPLTCGEAVAAVGHAASLALDAGPGGPLASTIVDLSGESPRLVRAGPVSWQDVERVLSPGRS